MQAEDLRDAAWKQQSLMVALRRDLHAHPELAFQEARTGRLMAEQMRELGLEVRDGVGGTGTVAVLRGARPGKTVALRADMDALPLTEESSKPYASSTPGVAHLCGHDAHCAMLVGAARVLVDLRDELAGNVKFIFEPAEEMAGVSGPSGAERMIADGVLDNPKVDAIFAAHVFPEYRTGTVALRAGSIMAGHARFDLSIIGRECHAALPHQGIDAVVVAAEVIQALQALASRRSPPGDTFALNVGTIAGGTQYNLLAGRVDMVGSVRTSDEELRKELGAWLERVIAGITSAHDAGYEFKFDPYTFPATSNDPELASFARRVFEKSLGEESVVWMDRPRLTGETFCYYLEKVPGVYFILGTGNEEKGTTWPSHHSRFDLDEDAMPIGASLLAELALAYLSR